MASEVKFSVALSTVKLSAEIAFCPLLVRVRLLPVELLMLRAPAVSTALSVVELTELSDTTVYSESALDSDLMLESVRVRLSRLSVTGSVTLAATVIV